MRALGIVLLITLAAGCAAPTADPTPPATATGEGSGVVSGTVVATDQTPPPATRDTMQRGVALSPRSYGASDFPAFFDEVDDVGGLVLWGGSARELANATSAAHVVAALARQKGLFPKRDMTAFTTYPGYVYYDVPNIPADHYTALADRFDGPIGFTEVGYNAALPVPSFETSPEEQAEFVERFLADAKAMDAKLAIWLHLYDQPFPSNAAVEHLGLREADGDARPAYDRWRDTAS